MRGEDISLEGMKKTVQYGDTDTAGDRKSAWPLLWRWILIFFGLILLLAGVCGLTAGAAGLIGYNMPAFSSFREELTRHLNDDIRGFSDLIANPWIVGMALMIFFLPLLAMLYEGLHLVLGFKSPQDCFRSLLASRGSTRLGESLDFLVKSCGIDLQNPSPSQSPEELRRILLDLQCVNVLRAMMERCDGLVGSMPRLYGETSLLNGRQLAEVLTNLTETPFPAAEDFASLLQSCGFAQLVAKIYFNTQLMELLRMLSPRLFAEDGDRFKLLDAAQENLDGLVKEEESEERRAKSEERKERAA